MFAVNLHTDRQTERTTNRTDCITSATALAEIMNRGFLVHLGLSVPSVPSNFNPVAFYPSYQETDRAYSTTTRPARGQRLQRVPYVSAYIMVKWRVRHHSYKYVGHRRGRIANQRVNASSPMYSVSIMRTDWVRLVQTTTRPTRLNQPASSIQPATAVQRDFDRRCHSTSFKTVPFQTLGTVCFSYSCSIATTAGRVFSCLDTMTDASRRTTAKAALMHSIACVAINRLRFVSAWVGGWNLKACREVN